MDKEMIMNQIEQSGVIPVVVLENADDAVPTANAFLAGGINVMEITFRTAAAKACIEAVSKDCPDMIVGAGTVTTIEQCKDAVMVGAQFIVSPGFNKEIVEWCVRYDIPVLPGCVTPTEIMSALSLGVQIVKFFPANIYGGLAALKALKAPFTNVQFVPTGGVKAENLAEYLSEPSVFAVGGTWLCKKDDILSGNWEKITSLCKEAKQIKEGIKK